MFLEHQDWIANIVDRVDAVPTHDDAAIRSQRRALITEIQEHEAFLDGELTQSWLTFKLATTTMNSRIRAESVDTS